MRDLSLFVVIDRRDDLSLSIWRGYEDGPFSGLMGGLNIQVEVSFEEDLGISLVGYNEDIQDISSWRTKY